MGALPWAALLLLTLIGRERLSKLKRWCKPLPPNPPPVTVLVPAKDEGPGIARCIEAILAQDYPSINVIAINDRSKDDTGKALDEIAARDSRVTVVHIQPGGLPDGWLGKCHALYVGSRRATSPWLLFVDSDVTLQPNALSTALSLCLRRQYDALSLLTQLECDTFLERLMLPPLAAAWTVMHKVSQTNDDNRPDVATANGQFFLIRRDAYEAVGGHETVKDQITEDVELMRALKSSEYRVRFFFGEHLASTRMHSNLHQMFNGWSRIYSGTSRRSPWRILGVIWFILTGVFTAYLALAWSVWRLSAAHDPEWFWLAFMHLGFMTFCLALIYQWGGSRMRYAVMAPVAGSIMLGILIYALRKCQTGQIIWRDTVFAAKPQRG